jgi:muramoyltetrapeptide carboxypeptidase
VIAAKLRPGDEVRVVSPAVSLGFIPEDQKLLARERLRVLGLRPSFSSNAEVLDRFDSSPVTARASDLRGAFASPGVKGILTTLGGYNSRASGGEGHRHREVPEGFEDGPRHLEGDHRDEA